MLNQQSLTRQARGSQGTVLPQVVAWEIAPPIQTAIDTPRLSEGPRIPPCRASQTQGRVLARPDLCPVCCDLSSLPAYLVTTAFFTSLNPGVSSR